MTCSCVEKFEELVTRPFTEFLTCPFQEFLILHLKLSNIFDTLTQYKAGFASWLRTIRTLLADPETTSIASP